MRPLARAALIAVALFAFLQLRGVRPALNQDTVRDLLEVRDCVERGLCGVPGVRTNVGLLQGVLWIQMLRAGWKSGLGIDGLSALVRALLSLSAGLVYLAARRLRVAAPVACAGLFVVLLLPAIRYPTLVYSSMPPLPVALVYACALHAVEGGRTRSWLAGAFCLGLAVDSHLTCALLLPCFFAALAATARSPALAAAGAGVAFTAALWLDSSAALALNASSLVATGGALALAAALLVAITGGAAARGRVARLDGPARARVAVWLHVTVFVALLGAGAIRTGHFLAPRYLTPALPALCFAVVLLVERAAPRDRRRPAAALIVALAFALCWALPGGWSPLYEKRVDWLLVDARTVADRLYADGWTWPGLYQRLQGPASRDLVSALGLFEPARVGHAAPPHDLAIVRGLRSESPPGLTPGGTLVPLGRDTFAVIRRFRSILDRRAVRVCTSDAPPGGPACVDVPLVPRESGELRHRGYPLHLAPLREPRSPSQGPLEMTYLFRVEVPGDGRDRVLSLCAADPWRFERADGISVRGALPSRRLVVDASAARTGTLAITLRGTADDAALAAWPPEILEVDAADRSLWRVWGERALNECSWPSGVASH